MGWAGSLLCACSLDPHQGAVGATQPSTCPPPSPSPRPPLQLISSCDLGDKSHLCSHKLDWQVSTPNLVNQEIVQSPERTSRAARELRVGGKVWGEGGCAGEYCGKGGCPCHARKGTTWRKGLSGGSGWWQQGLGKRGYLLMKYRSVQRKGPCKGVRISASSPALHRLCAFGRTVQPLCHSGPHLSYHAVNRAP